jgi:hypothetical protein
VQAAIHSTATSNTTVTASTVTQARRVPATGSARIIDNCGGSGVPVSPGVDGGATDGGKASTSGSSGVDGDGVGDGNVIGVGGDAGAAGAGRVIGARGDADRGVVVVGVVLTLGISIVGLGGFLAIARGFAGV